MRATLVVPILQGEQLWGLLVANHCSSPRQWQQLEIDLLKQLATASDGMEAIALYIQHQNEISLVLTDIMMASMDGSTLLRTLQKINPHVKVIAMSGLGSNTKIADGIAVKAFLSKPYTTKELLKTINEVKCN